MRNGPATVKRGDKILVNSEDKISSSRLYLSQDGQFSESDATQFVVSSFWSKA